MVKSKVSIDILKQMSDQNQAEIMVQGDKALTNYLCEAGWICNICKDNSCDLCKTRQVVDI